MADALRLRRRRLVGAIGTSLLVGATAGLAAARLPAPSGEVLLTVAGQIAATSGAMLTRLDRDLLPAWGSDQPRAANAFTHGALRAYPVLLALGGDGDGQPRTVRERGPVWVIHPWSLHPELDDSVHRQRSIWQPTEIEVT